MNKTNPIGFFDSGIGGLTVVRAVTRLMPNENIVYFGDTARVPYGSKSNDTVVEYSLQAANFLLRKNIKLLVVACNTASSVALKELRKFLTVPVIVIRPLHTWKKKDPLSPPSLTADIHCQQYDNIQEEYAQNIPY